MASERDVHLRFARQLGFQLALADQPRQDQQDADEVLFF
jgi:hypothetical protein